MLRWGMWFLRTSYRLLADIYPCIYFYLSQKELVISIDAALSIFFNPYVDII